MTCCKALNIAGVALDVEPTTERSPVNSSARMISCVCWPGEGSGRSCGSNEMTSPTEVAGGLVDGGCGGFVCLPAAQCGHGPRSWRLSVMSVHVSVLKGILPVDRLEQRLLSDGWQRSMWSCSAASARARCSALMW